MTLIKQQNKWAHDVNRDKDNFKVKFNNDISTEISLQWKKSDGNKNVNASLEQ